MDNKVYNTHCNNIFRVAEDGEVIWTTTCKNGYQRTYRTYGCKTSDGHRKVRYKGKEYLVHRLVAECFLNDGKPLPDGYDVHHKNGNPEDNKVSNLLILTHEEHIALHHKGKHYRPNIPIIGVHKVTGEVREFESIADAARVLNISQGHISECLSGRLKSTGGFKWYCA